MTNAELKAALEGLQMDIDDIIHQLPVADTPITPPPVVTPPAAGVVFEDALFADPFLPAPTETPLESHRFESAKWEAVATRAALSRQGVRLASGADGLDTTLADENGSYAFLVLCPKIPGDLIDFTNKTLCFEGEWTAHNTVRRQQSAFVLPNGDKDLADPAVWEKLFNPFTSGLGIALNVGDKQVACYDCTPEKGLIGNDPTPPLSYRSSWVWNPDQVGYESYENGYDADIANMVMHKFKLCISATRIKFWEQGKVKVDMPRVSKWTKAAIMFGPWFYHHENENFYLAKCAQVNPQFTEKTFLDTEPTTDLRCWKNIKISLLESMP